MQVTIYHSDEDEYLLELVDAKAKRERKSRSAVILTILEGYFEKQKRVGEILLDLGAITHSDLSRALDMQKAKFEGKLLGDLLLEEELAERDAVERALMIQGRHHQESGGV